MATVSSNVNSQLEVSVQETAFVGPDTTSEVETGRNYGAISSNDTIAATDNALRNPIPGSDSPSPRALAPDLLRGLLMVLQAIDHSAAAAGAWRHGVALEPEMDGLPVYSWNSTIPLIARMLTHLCGPGFMFLLGMGVVYFGRSRGKLGWTSRQLLSHFALRAVVLALVNQVCFAALAPLFGLPWLWVMNPVLLALAVNYLLAGLLFLALDFSEKGLSRLLAAKPVDEQTRPLLGDSVSGDRASDSLRVTRGGSISWHLHSLILAVLTGITIAWNHWLSPDHGTCGEQSVSTQSLPAYRASAWGTAFDFWFYPVFSQRIISPFPPLAWLSFALLGMLYARIALARSWPSITINLGNGLAGLTLLLLFVLTRVLRFGNLSEDCLNMPEQAEHPGLNQYLASFRSFFYIVKYPPSFAYFAFTSGFNFLLLAFFGVVPPKIAIRIPALMVFGTSALFFFIMHHMLYAITGTALKKWFGHELGYRDGLSGKPAFGVGNTPTYWIFYLVGLAILYPLCRWYGRFKRGKGPNSIWRFF